jgi:hypothetical protein
MKKILTNINKFFNAIKENKKLKAEISENKNNNKLIIKGLTALINRELELNRLADFKYKDTDEILAALDKSFEDYKKQVPDSFEPIFSNWLKSNSEFRKTIYINLLQDVRSQIVNIK